ncbi:helix-turn-helix transcriptional regulator [Kitasatospora sp. MAP5-34]|uniref:helix-turn-helix domain-containing protein n=1 Tax=Kitasatospora sp. MAP5-34 TaxID=3035102 RepID=UPI0024739A85|nr:helix-turn-helix transcriptional regulator [Kitasatospora sp. MAP5-34]MDH6580706.1 transcriptional regulator with XRE-family HTH domain [Kitasatospora sp. MAP5-34]
MARSPHGQTRSVIKLEHRPRRQPLEGEASPSADRQSTLRHICGTIPHAASAFRYVSRAYGCAVRPGETRNVGWLLNWNSAAIRDASRARNYGRVIELARTHLRVTQLQLGEACGLSQSAISRLEKRGVNPYAMDLLGRLAAHLGIPAGLLGLAENGTQVRNGTEHVDRRQFIGGVAAAAATPVLAAVPELPDESVQQAAALRLGTTAFRRLDGSTPSRELADVVHSHMRLIQGLAGSAPTDSHRSKLAAVASVKFPPDPGQRLLTLRG